MDRTPVAISETRISRIDRLELRFAPRPWRFADERRADIDAHFAKLRRDKPAMWNGRVLILHGYAIDGATLSGAYLETDFASFIAWRDWGWPDQTMHNCFGLAALRAADGAFLVGVMAGHTSNAGWIYFPGGTPDLNDVVGHEVDLAGSVMRELAEETGLTGDDVEPQPGWYAVESGHRLALVKILHSRLAAPALRDRVQQHLSGQASPELADVRIVRSRADFDPLMPSFMTAFLAHAWR